jgi:hypothetical protein
LAGNGHQLAFLRLEVVRAHHEQIGQVESVALVCQK